MKLQDLYNSVSQLGFEDTLGDDGESRFIYATNRALSEINTLRPRRKSVTINHIVPTNLLESFPKQIEKQGKITLSANNAKSFYFEVCGKGSYAVYMRTKKTLAGITQIVDIEAKSGNFDFRTFTAIKGTIKHEGAFVTNAAEPNSVFTGEILLEFDGVYDYTIRNVALYDRVFSDNESDIIPYSEKVPYCMANIVDDFERFDSSPLEVSSEKYLNDNFSILNSDTILLPLDKPGAYKINYIHKVTLFNRSGIDYNADIDLDEDLAQLMPNLVAAYVWLDDEAEKAQYYMSIYNQRAASIQNESKDLTPVLFQSVYGW